MSDTTIDLLSAADITDWHSEHDLLVVGFGAAGACAAIESAQAGNSVLVVERGSGIGGTTSLATGHFYLGGGTRVQLANGIEDSADEMFNYLMANTPDPDAEKIRAYADDSVSHFNWLVEQGVPFNDGFYRKKHYEQPTDECLIWSGNEKAWPYSQQAKPAPRGHKVEHLGSGGGAIVMQKLGEAAKQLKVKFQFDAQVNGLIKNQTGRIVGLRYKTFGDTYYLRANKAVVIAAGGFSMNKTMVEEHCPQLNAESVWPQGTPYDDGSGIQLGLVAGGQAIHMSQVFLTSPFYPPESLVKGILVNQYGQRFINEDSYHSRSAAACIEQPNGVAYLICDNATFGRPELKLQELIDAWDTVEEMEQALALPKGALQDTINQYNQYAELGKDPTQHKHVDWLQPLNQPPFAALECSFEKSSYTGFTLGGLQVSKDAEVLDHHRQAITGLYAAGACASNIAQDGTGYSSGTCIGEATYFGRRAAKHAHQLSPSLL